jgi:hypothetical protein
MLGLLLGVDPVVLNFSMCKTSSLYGIGCAVNEHTKPASLALNPICQVQLQHR